MVLVRCIIIGCLVSVAVSVEMSFYKSFEYPEPHIVRGFLSRHE